MIKPLSEAPKNGTLVDLLHKDGHIVPDAQWIDGRWTQDFLGTMIGLSDDYVGFVD